jgi:hypothetical protein
MMGNEEASAACDRLANKCKNFCSRASSESMVAAEVACSCGSGATFGDGSAVDADAVGGTSNPLPTPFCMVPVVLMGCTADDEAAKV